MANQYKLFNQASNDHLADFFQCNRESAIKELYNAYYKQLITLANGILHDRCLAEDVVQNTFITIWDKRASLPVPINLKGYLVVCVKRKAYDAIKKEKKRMEQPMPDYEDERMGAMRQRGIEDKEIYNGILKAMKCIPPKQRKVFEQRYLHDLSSREIMANSQLSAQTIRNHMHTCIRIMRKKLKHHYS